MSSEAACFTDALARNSELRHALSGAEERGTDAAPVLPSEALIAERPVHPECKDDQLLKLVRDGSKEALGHLFRRHGRAVRNVAYRILRSEAEADDLVQEVFLFIFRKAALYNSANGKAANWIIHLAYHRAFDRRRYLNSRRFYATEELSDRSLHLADPTDWHRFEQSLESVLGKPLLEKFNAHLSPEQQETIRLFFFEGYALKEIAEMTGRSLVNVRSHYYRGLERMRKYLFPEKIRSK